MAINCPAQAWMLPLLRPVVVPRKVMPPLQNAMPVLETASKEIWKCWLLQGGVGQKDACKRRRCETTTVKWCCAAEQKETEILLRK